MATQDNRHLGKNSRGYVWWKADGKWNTLCLGLYGCRNGGARVSNVLGCICKDEVGSITEVEGNINSAKCVIIFFHCSCIVQCSLFRHHRTRFFFYFQRNRQFFSQQLSCESHKLLNRLTIDLLQIGNGTDWLNSFIKSRKLLLQSNRNR
jgi:hypothetical protein